MMVNDLLQKINERLKSAQIGVKVEQINNRLYLRATLPPKPGQTHLNIDDHR